MVRFHTQHEIDLGAGAYNDTLEFSKQGIHALILRYYMLGAGGAATLANAKTQLGTKIYCKDGRGKVTPEWSLTELYEYSKAFFNRIPTFQDGTAADNKAAFLNLVIPFGRPFKGGSNNIFDAVDPYVGWNPDGTPEIYIDAPADANSIDARTLDITVIYADSKRLPYGKKWTDWYSKTLSTTSYKDFTVGNKGHMLEMFCFVTSEENATLTSDAPTLHKCYFDRNGSAVLFEKDTISPISALLDSDICADDQYQHMALADANREMYLGQLLNLNKGEVKFRAKGGVADAFKASFSKIDPSF